MPQKLNSKSGFKNAPTVKHAVQDMINCYQGNGFGGRPCKTPDGEEDAHSGWVSIKEILQLISDNTDIAKGIVPSGIRIYFGRHKCNESVIIDGDEYRGIHNVILVATQVKHNPVSFNSATIRNSSDILYDGTEKDMDGFIASVSGVYAGKADDNIPHHPPADLSGLTPGDDYIN